MKRTTSARMGRIAGGLLLITLGFACESGITTPDRAPTLEGILVGVNGCDFTEACIAVVPDSIWRVWIKEDEADPCGVYLGVDRSTALVVREGSAIRAALPEEFVPWRPARAWVVGNVIAESCPGQAAAEAIELN